MIHQLKLAGVFDRIGGLIVGRFTEYEEDDLMYRPLYESIRQAVDEYNFPVALVFRWSREAQLPTYHGRRATLSVNHDSLTLKQ